MRPPTGTTVSDDGVAGCLERAAEHFGGLQDVEVTTVEGPVGEAVRVDLTLRWEDARGEAQRGRGTAWLPAGASSPLPLLHSAGYELPEEAALATVQDGFVVTTPGMSDLTAVAENPLVRGPNLDLTLLRLARATSCVDRTRVVIAGGSAGGYTALMLAAEAFPLAGVTVDAAVVNLCYEGAFAFEQERRFGHDRTEVATRLSIGILPPLAHAALARYGGVESDDVLAHSPVAHVERITCPVSAVFSTADMLVPIEQLGAGLVPEVPDDSVGVLAMDDLVHEPRLRTRLLDVLAPDDVCLRRVASPSDALVMDWANPLPAGVRTFATPPFSPGGPQWSITVLDEGPPQPTHLHYRYAFLPEHSAFRAACVAAALEVRQLTEAKLDQLMARYVAEEWMAPGFRHLGDPAVERADVVAGLRAYCAVSGAHRSRFASLYGGLRPARQVLDEELVRELAGDGGTAR